MQNMRSYGACSQGHQAPLQKYSPPHFKRAVLIFMTPAFLVVLVISFAAVGRHRGDELLMPKAQILMNMHNLAQEQLLASGSPAAITAPAAEDASSFKNSAMVALAQINVKDVSQTDLEASCQTSTFPCIDKILTCVNSKLVKTTDGKVSPSSDLCNCFSRGFVEGVPVPDNQDIKFGCSYECVESILQTTEQFVSDTNGPSGDSIRCKSTIKNIASQSFGNSNGYIPSAGDVDAMEVIPVDDPKAVRAAEALRFSINSQRRLNCPARSAIEEPGRIQYAKRGIVSDGYGQYKMEVTFGRDIVFARISHLPKDKQLTDPASQAALDDPQNLDGRFVILSSVPGPCENGIAEQLAVSATDVDAINKQNLPWSAALREEHEGKRLKDFGMGFVPLPEEKLKQYRVVLDTTDFTPPESYDARDVYADQTPCKAYAVMNQGGCGSCYAFAAATAFSARLCRGTPTSVGNVLISPQQIMDCSGGCNGGNPIVVYERLTTTPDVELWCDPYAQVKQTCSTLCPTGNQYLGQPRSVRLVGGRNAGPTGVLQMQLELMRNGPGVVDFFVMSDFGKYASGVYTVSENATVCGLHAVVLLGWGVEGGVPYWICQNSWGTGFGEGGFFRIRRGTNEAKMESNSGMAVIRPAVPTVCPDSKCAVGAVTLKDCTCRCDNPAMSGPTCSECTLVCLNGGVRDAGCTKCACPLGFFGQQCEGGYQVAPLASCADEAVSITVTYAFGGGVLSPTQQTFVGLYPPKETGAFKHLSQASLCGAKYPKYDKAVNGGLCPTAGLFKITAPKVPGQYKMVVVPWSPMNEFGQQGYYSLKAKDVIAQFTVLPAGCSAADKAVAQAANEPAALLGSAVAAAESARAAQLAAMRARLDAAKPLLASLTAEQPASLAITNLAPGGLVWMGIPYQICYRLPPSANVNPKKLFLVLDDGKGSYWGSVLGNGNNNLPTGYQDCVEVTMSGGLPISRYFIELRDRTTGNNIIRTEVYRASQASIWFSSLTPSASYVTVKCSWRMDPALASPTDIVKILNVRGDVTYWFYTSCKCKTAPGAVAVPTGDLSVKIMKLNSIPGGYKIKFYPGGGEFAAGVGSDWIAWSKYGL